MITIKNGKKDLEMRFGIGQLDAIDKALGFKVKDRVELGEGLEKLVSKLESGNAIAIAKIIKATTRGQQHSPKNDEELEGILVDLIKEHGSLKKFGEIVLEDMGKNVLTQDVINNSKALEAKEI
ncbi:tail assembly chaperone [Staphylococcus hominis]